MARRKAPAIPDSVLDQLLQGGEAKDAFGRDGLLDALTKALAERALNAELDHHLAAGEPDERANSRNGFGAKTVLTDTGKIELEIPRDRMALPVGSGAPRMGTKRLKALAVAAEIPCRRLRSRPCWRLPQHRYLRRRAR